MQPPAKERKAKAKLSPTDTQQTADLLSKEAQKEMMSTEGLTEHVSVPDGKLELRRCESRFSSGLFSVYPPPSVADKRRKFIENIEKGIVLCPSPLASPSQSLTPPLLGEYDKDEGNEGNEDDKYSENNGNDYHENCSAPLSSAAQVVVNSPRANKILIAVQ